MQQDTNYIISLEQEETIREGHSTPVLNYSELLERYGIAFRRAGNYLEVGEIDWVQGWILDISVVQTQVASLLECILPTLIRDNTPFVLVRNMEIARSVLAAELGYHTLAKVISIYPMDSDHAVELALELIALTSSFKGPEILTDRQLGKVVYTRYGAGNAVTRMNDKNIEEKYIYGPTGNLVKDPLTIPFSLPEGVIWPFDRIVPVQPAKIETVLQDRYRPMAVLKEDAKGSVRKGLWLERIYRIKWCVLKEGRKCMNSDDSGRDIHDRLRWQFDLQKNLEGIIPVPKVYDLFDENGNTYLIMELIRGVSLDTVIVDTLHGKPWPAQPLDIRLLLLDYASQVLDIIGTMHEQGYLHRDIMPNNFLVTKQHRVWMIDLELSYSQRLRKPYPPFRLGTPGFMSPEQQEAKHPTIEQDIYAIGATMIVLLTGLLPSAFSMDDQQLITDQLYLFIRDEEFIKILAASVSSNPSCRPSIPALKAALAEFRNRQIRQESIRQRNLTTPIVNKENLKDTIDQALKGLSTSTFMDKDQLWFSRTEVEEGMDYYQSKSTSIYPGFYQGLSGVLYLLAKGYKTGFSISHCMGGYENSLTYIGEMNSGRLTNVPAGLYAGTAGMALALTKAIESGLISRHPVVEQDIKDFLQNEFTDGYGIAKGLAGKGFVLLHATEILNAPDLAALLRHTIYQLLSFQQPDGSWISITDNRTHIKATGYAHGVSGITCFLLEYLQRHKDTNVEIAVTRSLQWLMQQAHKKKGEFIWYTNNKSKQIDSGFDNGMAGIILCLVRAFKVLGGGSYRQTAEKVLATIPDHWMKRDITLATGLTGIGEVYLEAAKVFSSEQWQNRANWIAQLLLHYVKKQNDGISYWLTEGIAIPTASLMLGNSGVIHFLMHYCKPDQLNHPLLII